MTETVYAAVGVVEERRYALVVAGSQGKPIFMLREDGTIEGDPNKALASIQERGETDSASIIARAILLALTKREEQ